MIGKLILVIVIALVVVAVAWAFYMLGMGIYRTFSTVHNDKQDLLELRNELEPVINHLRTRN